MAKDIGPGSLVRVVDDSPGWVDGRIPPFRRGQIVTVDTLIIGFYPKPDVDIREDPGHTTWCIDRFVPVDDDDIAIFRELVTDPPKELADA